MFLLSIVFWVVTVIIVVVVCGMIATAVEMKLAPTNLNAGRIGHKVFWYPIIVAAFHPAVLTYPTPSFLSSEVAAEVLSDGSLRRLPYGAIDFLVDGPIVRLGQEINCKSGVMSVGFEVKGTGVRGILENVPRKVTVSVDDDVFYKAFIGGRADQQKLFCSAVKEIFHKELQERFTGRELDFSPEEYDASVEREALRAALVKRIAAERATYGLKKIEIEF